MIIKGIVAGQTLSVCPVQNLAEGTVNAICAEFTFSAEWRGLVKTAFFMRGADGPYQAPISSDGTIAAAAGHLNFGAGLWKVSVAGERFEDGKVVHRLTTGVAHFVVSESIVDPDGQPFPGVPPTGQGEPGKPALIGSNGNWLIYNIDLEEYVDTGLSSRGPEGAPGKDGKVPDDIILVDGTPSENTHMLVDTVGETIEVLTAEDIDGLYTKPSGGIPESDLAADVRDKLNSGGGGGSDVTKETVKEWGFAEEADLAAVATSGSYNDLSDKPSIPAAVTSATVSGWGFAKRSEIPAAVTDAHIIDVIESAFPNAEGVGF